MRNLILLICFTFVFISCKKQDSTESNTDRICSDTTFIKTSIIDAFQSVFFISEKDGFVSGYKGGIYKTTDSAKTWVSLNSTTTLPVLSLFFTDPLKGFAVGGQLGCNTPNCVSPGGFILRTLDGGQTWTTIYIPTRKVAINSIFFISSLVGFCAGKDMVLKTTDGGQTWNEYTINNISGLISQIQFSDAQNGYLTSSGSKLFQTKDGGNTWLEITPYNGYGYSAIAATPGAVYVSGKKIMKSTDDGKSWRELANAPSGIYALHFFNENEGYAVGSGNYSGGDFGYSYGAVYCTSNGGKTWNGSSDIRQTTFINAVSFPARNIGYAVSSNTIIRLTSK